MPRPVLLLLLFLCGACVPGLALPPQEAFETVPLPEELHIETLARGPGGALWAGGASTMLVVSREGAVVRRLQLPTARGSWRLERWTADRMVLISEGGAVAIMDRPAGPIRALYQEAPPGRAVLADAEWIYEILANSAVYGVAPAAGEVRWAWARLGLPTLAAMLAPEADRLYQVIGDEDGGSLLRRDLETGRTLGRSPVPGRALAITAGLAGGIFVASVVGGELSVLRYPAMPEDSPPEWTALLGGGFRGSDVGIAVSPMGDQMVVWTPGASVFLDPASGVELGRMGGGFEDAAYDDRGRLHVLREGALLRWRGAEASPPRPEGEVGNAGAAATPR